VRVARRSEALVIAKTAIDPGETADITLKLSERYTGAPVEIPVRVVRASKPGPKVFVTAAIHGDELNGVGIVRDLMMSDVELTRGTIVLVPMVNVFGIEQRSRYLPDRRDLNRAFPGSPRGSLASRIAHTIFSEIVKKCDWGIDLHTAAVGRTNFPHIRVDLGIAGLPEMAHAFGCEVIVNARGDAHTLRAAATRSGCPTLLLEGGESLKIEPAVVNIGCRGVINVLKHLEMVEGEPTRPAYQTTVDKSQWVRAHIGGMLRFHVGPGDVVDKGDALVSVDNFLARKSESINAPVAGIVLGMPTMPAVKPGDPICHIAVPSRPLADIRDDIRRSPGTLHRRVQAAQAALVDEPRED
jgi:uncharacterized protein